VTNDPGAGRPHPDASIQRDEAFDDALAALITDLHLRVRFRELAIERAIRQGRYTAVSDIDGLILTEPGFRGVPACVVWFEFVSDPARGRIVILRRIAAQPALADEEDEGPA
jgi:hypothetical protein